MTVFYLFWIVSYFPICLKLFISRQSLNEQILVVSQSFIIFFFVVLETIFKKTIKIIIIFSVFLFGICLKNKYRFGRIIRDFGQINRLNWDLREKIAVAAEGLDVFNIIFREKNKLLKKTLHFAEIDANRFSELKINKYSYIKLHFVLV
jgi:hypothetical protein